LFHFRITPSFLIGSSTVLIATWMYNQPAGQQSLSNVIGSGQNGKLSTPFPGTGPVSPTAPILGQFPNKTKGSPFGSPRAIATALGLGPPESPTLANGTNLTETELDTKKLYLESPYGSPFPSRTPTPAPSLHERQ
jgi:UDP-sugar transporter A1/2/3